MWVWRDRYNKLQSSCEFWKNEYASLYDSKVELMRNYSNILDGLYTYIEILKDEIASLKAENEELKEYKQKYADEVQKRLELVKLLENTHLTNQ